MSTTKETMDCYRVRANGEWATICLREWEVRDDKWTGEKVRYCGEILIHSSFGSWGNSWSHCGNRFKQFLTHLGFDYIFTKFMGGDLERFDGDKSFSALCKRIREARRGGTLDKEDARELWDEVHDREESLGHSVESWVDTLCDISRDNRSREVKRFLEEPWTMTVESPDASATGFWRDIWPEFRATLLAEVTEQVAA